MDSPPTTVPPAPARSAARRLWRVAVSLLAVLLLVTAVAAAALGWALFTPGGNAWLLTHVPGLTVTAPHGRLLGDFAAARVEWRLPSGLHVDLRNLRWQALRLERAHRQAFGLALRMDTLEAERIEVTLPDAPPGPPASPPDTLALPLEIDIGRLQVGALHMAALGDTPLRELKARLHLGDEAGTQHRIDDLSLVWGRLRAGASLQIGTQAPLPLRATLNAAQDATADLPAWNANATVGGTLAGPQVQATLRAQPTAQRQPQALDLSATLKPFERWPLGALQARTQALDLSALLPAAPTTALSGTADVETRGADQPASVQLALDNAAAGRWNEGRLPVRRLAADVRGQPDSPDRFDLNAVTIELGTVEAAAGRVTGSGQWTPARWALDARFDGVQPEQLDTRAPPMRIDGPLTLAGSGFDATGPNTADAATIDVRSRLSARLTGGTLGVQWRPQQPRELQLDLDATLSALRIELRELQARTGSARAKVTGRLQRDERRAPWQLDATMDAVDFDPSPWVPGRADAPWRRGQHRLNAQGRVALQVPAVDTPADLLDRIAALRGQATLKLGNSVLAGVPLSGQVELAASDGTQVRPTLSLDLAGNALRVEGRLATSGLAAALAPAPAASAAAAPIAPRPTRDGASDRWQVELDAPALDRLAPLWQMAAAADADLRVSGALRARANVEGRWPALRSDGELTADAVRVGPGALPSAQARWRLGSTVDAPMELQATLKDARWGEHRLSSVEAQVSGSGNAHRIELRAVSAARPPAWVDVVQTPTGTAAPAGSGGTAALPAQASASAAAASASGTSPAAHGESGTAPRSVAVLRAQGGWLARAGEPRGGWRGTVEQLEWRPTAPSAPAWVRTRDLGLDLQWAGGPVQAIAQPGRVELLGGALRWSRLLWQAAEGSNAAQVDVQAELEPIAVAPILARLQPTFGWGGDLQVGGHVRLRAAPGMTADVVIERRSGDLSVTDETGTQSLGLSDLRLALDARNGTWNFTQALAGKTLGIGAGAVVVQTPPQATWPDADAPLQGVMELQVANLGTWGTWVPAGWRLGGAVRIGAAFGGRLGAPEYTGEVRGERLSVRNFLEGVNVSDGDLRVTLRGETARIERFTLKAGDGQLRIDGTGSFGEAPQARLQVVAERFQLLGRVDRRIVTSGQAQLQLDRESLALNGRFGVDEALIDFTRSDAPSLSDDVEVVRPKPAGAPAPAPPQASATAPKRRVDLNLQVDLGEQLRLRGRGLDTRLRGLLRLTSPEGRLAVNGTVNTDEGRYVAYGQKLTIDRGIVSFSGPVDNPRLNIEAIRPDLDVRVGVAITGTAVNPRVKLFSVPEMSEKDKLSWLLLGRPSDTLGGTETALLQRAALALLSGEGEGKTDQLIRAVGLDQLSVRQSDGEVRETIVSLGKQISRRWYVGYERSLNATAGTWQLIYRVARSFTLRAQAGYDNSFDAIWNWRW